MLWRTAVFAILAGSLAFGQQLQPMNVPGSVTSPTTDSNGRTTFHGVPASVLSPIPLPPGVHTTSHVARRVAVPSGRIPFGDSHGRRDHKVIVPVPVFYPVYGGGYSDYQVPPPADHYADSVTPQPETAVDTGVDPDALRQAYFQGAHDALAQQQEQSRYGQHYFGSREQKPPVMPAPDQTAESKSPETAPVQEEETDLPSAVFIFKDGHQLETRSYAIMGQTLFDFSGHGVKKVQLAELDTDATRKANDDRGITVKLP